MIKATTKSDLRRIQELRKSLRSGQGPMQDVLDVWERQYRAFIVKRFDVYSRGGGDWQPNTPARRKKKRSNRVLVDTKFLRLKLEQSIQVIKRVGLSITIAFRSSVVHPAAKMEIEELERIHDQGLGNNPKRQILVTPDDELNRLRSEKAKQILTDFLNAG